MPENNDHIEDEDVGTGMKKPFNPNSIKVGLKAIPVYAMVERIRHDEINLRTAFQRKEGLWDDKQQSRLIESILIRFPLPVFYFEGSNPDKWLVIDGLQRLTSLRRFMVTKELKLTNLEFLDGLEGKGWDDLDRPQQRQINETTLQCHIIEEGDRDAVYHIFKRINTGGLILSDQEIRHAMHQDVADYLKQLAESPEFIAATQNKISPERMMDRDFVNRFLAFYLLGHEKDYAYEDDLDTFMNRALKKVARSTEDKRKDIEKRFKAAMTLSKNIFGDAAFCKKRNYKRINKALFEVVSVSFAKLSEAERNMLLSNKTKFKKLFYKNIKNFKDSLTSNTGGKSNIALRHDQFNIIVNTILNE